MTGITERTERTKAEITFEKYAFKFPKINFRNTRKVKKLLKLKYNPSGEAGKASKASKTRFEKGELLSGFIPGALATAISTGVMYPVDTAQMRAQTGAPPPENVGDYYKGMKMKLVKAIPSGAIAFGLTPIFRKLLMKK